MSVWDWVVVGAPLAVVVAGVYFVLFAVRELRRDRDSGREEREDRT